MRTSERAAESATPSASDWWPTGDFPPCEGCRVTPCVDGHVTMLRMCQAFLRAKQYILLAGWDIHVDLPLVRGEDVPAGAAAEPQRQALVAALRAAGLDDEAITFWLRGRLRVRDVLGFAASRGVRVGVLLWDAYHLGSHITNDPHAQQQALASVGVDCLLDDSSRRVAHMTQSLHQKCSVVDGRVAFIGGIDLTVQDGGDYDRWDTHQHPCASDHRMAARRASTHPWHDVHSELEGAVVADVQRNIVQRWMDVATRHTAATWPGELGEVPATPALGDAVAQVVRTIPPHTYGFAPNGIATVKDLYVRAIRKATTFIYLENQYLWPEVFLGLDTLRWGERSQDMADVLEALAEALARGVHVAITLPDHPNCGRRFTDGGVEWLRARARDAGVAERFHALTLGTAEDDPAAPGGMFYRPVYTHAKVAIVDDCYWTVGSANLNSRGMRSDAEINVGVYDPTTARQLRLTLWTEHLRRAPHLHHGLDEPISGLTALHTLADANRERVRARQPIVGHVLPYLTAQDAGRLQLPVHAEHGWLDNLPGGSGSLAAHQAGRYL